MSVRVMSWSRSQKLDVQKSSSIITEIARQKSESADKKGQKCNNCGFAVIGSLVIFRFRHFAAFIITNLAKPADKSKSGFAGYY